MITLSDWLSEISNWYQQTDMQDMDTLSPLIHSPPEAVWGPELSDEQSKAIACWLDGCLRLYKHYHQDIQSDKAYGYLQLAYSKLQFVATQPHVDKDIKQWAIKRLDHLIVLLLEFCNQQQSASWQAESQNQIELHVAFMNSLHNINLEGTMYAA
ncbi:transcriptional regulator [Vibrio sp. Of7-15]|uniref:transcriptional regulator n=1 Tax=Vibrio sp. Of7-15 TaxID=2724879 RepID=UPI001EF350B5|nr:transcriptional regulator [Vibrio sp. Of7-15]MCG7497930.1 transcriptional regulator [Vibrio sp. Of7-15]